MSIDLLTPTQDAVFTALDTSIGAAVATVHVHVPARGPKDPPPSRLVVIGGITEDDDGDRDEPRSLITIEIHAVFSGKDRVPLLAIVAAVRAALDDVQLPDTDGVGFSRVAWRKSVVDSVAANGVTYAAAIIFEVYAEPA